MTFSKNLTLAIKDYSLLLEKGYPDKRTLELVADRYQLDRNEKAVLFRGVFKRLVSNRRREKVIRDELPEYANLKVDALNQLYSIASYLSGKLVFIASDGILRDASEIHGRKPVQEMLVRALGTLLQYLHRRPGINTELFLDNQVDIYTTVRVLLEQSLPMASSSIKIIGSGHVDADLSSGDSFVLATSDSVIMDRTPNRVFDLARFVIEHHFSGKIPEVADILSEID